MPFIFATFHLPGRCAFRPVSTILRRRLIRWCAHWQSFSNSRSDQKKTGMWKKARPYGRVKRRRPIFPWSYPHSIVGAEELNFRVRDGNGCLLFAIATGSPAHTGGSSNTIDITTAL